VHGTSDTGASPDSCTKTFKLCELIVGKPDKLGNMVIEILWVGQDYIVYQSEKGIYAHFADKPEEEKVQRDRFTKISPELCELRYLTTEMNYRQSIIFPWKPSKKEPSLYGHNMAQAIMLTMEDKCEDAQEIAQRALEMAARRVTNDNTIRYISHCLVSALWVIIIGSLILFFASNFTSLNSTLWSSYVIAGMAGAVGAVLSVATRLQAFDLRPCYESRMNDVMSIIRVLIGVISGIGLFLFATRMFGETVTRIFHLSDASQPFDWPTAAILGLIAGFAERLVPTLISRTINNIEFADEGLEFGESTPVQAFRQEEKRKKRN
jgi:hypothetical protein